MSYCPLLVLLLVVAASAQQKQLAGDTFVRLNFQLESNTTLKNHVIELSIPQFYELLHELERACTIITPKS